MKIQIGWDAVITILLGALKITGVLDISWLTVFSPMILATSVLFVLLAITGAIAVFLTREGKLVVNKRGENQ